MVYVFLANGFEEIEALAPVDMLRRAGIETITVGIGGKVIKGAHEIIVTADIDESQMHKNGLEAIVLPGGGLGTANLETSPVVEEYIEYSVNHGLVIAAICAAPSILGKRGLLQGKQATAYPEFQEQLQGANLSDDYICQDGNFLTARGMGVSLEFAFKLIEMLKGTQKAEEIREQIQCVR